MLSRLSYYISSIPTLLLGIKNWPAIITAFLGLRVPERIVLELRNGCHFRVRTPMDIWIIKETCLDRQYERQGVEIKDGWVVLDIGAGLGDFAICVALEHPHSTVYAYEPFLESFAMLEENLDLNQVRNVKAFPYALSSQVGSIDFHIVSKEAVQHSTAFGLDGAQDSIQVPSTTLDHIFDEIQSDRCDYLKMDCEGAEYEILLNASDSALQRIGHICLEYHDGVTEFSHHDLVRFLEGKGFRVWLTPNPAWAHLGFLYAMNRRTLDN
ncbi:MAG TPA: FkbM family methyltransferase [Chloroflexi bacterium]|nr:FkbM family methyltransferase [Chloroflexota bacterium]